MKETAVQEKRDIASRFRCVGEQLLVRRLEVADDMTAGGIIKPETARQRSTRGEIVALNPVLGHLDLKPGDTVRFSKYGGTDVEIDGEIFVLLHWKMIYLVETCEE